MLKEWEHKAGCSIPDELWNMFSAARDDKSSTYTVNFNGVDITMNRANTPMIHVIDKGDILQYNDNNYKFNSKDDWSGEAIFRCTHIGDYSIGDIIEYDGERLLITTDGHDECCKNRVALVNIDTGVRCMKGILVADNKAITNAELRVKLSGKFKKIDKQEVYK